MPTHNRDQARFDQRAAVTHHDRLQGCPDIRSVLIDRIDELFKIVVDARQPAIPRLIDRLFQLNSSAALDIL